MLEAVTGKVFRINRGTKIGRKAASFGEKKLEMRTIQWSKFLDDGEFKAVLMGDLITGILKYVVTFPFCSLKPKKAKEKNGKMW